MFTSSSTLSPVTVPSAFAASVTFCHWSRPWCPDINDSDLVSLYLQGFPVRRAAMTVSTSSGVNWSLPPKPPPTSGAITRTLLSGMPSTSEVKIRTKCGTWVDDQIVSCSGVGSTAIARGSMKAGMSRCWRISFSITMPPSRAAAIAASTSPPVPDSAESYFQTAETFVPRSGWAITSSVGRGPQVEHRRQFLVVHVDQVGGVVRLGRVTGDDHGNDLTGEGDVVDRHRRVHRRLLIRGDLPGVRQRALLVGDVRAGQDGDHAGRGAGRLGVDAGDPRVRERAADHREVQHAGQDDVVGPAGPAGDQARVLLAAARIADLGRRAVLGGGHRPPPAAAAARTAFTMFW